MSHLKKFEKQVLNTLDNLPEYADMSLNTRKALIKEVWKHLNKNVHLKGGSVAGSKREENIDPSVQTSMDTLKLLSSAMTAYNFGKMVIPYLL